MANGRGPWTHQICRADSECLIKPISELRGNTDRLIAKVGLRISGFEDEAGWGVVEQEENEKGKCAKPKEELGKEELGCLQRAVTPRTCPLAGPMLARTAAGLRMLFTGCSLGGHRAHRIAYPAPPV